jgi:type I restriction enzyme, S subunit
MTKWPHKPLAEVATVGSGAGFPIADQGKNGGDFPFLKVSDMNLPGNARTIESWNNTVTEEVRARLRATAFPSGSVIFPKIGAAIGTNKKRLLTRPCCVDNNVMAVTPNRGSLAAEYLFYLLLATDISHFASDSNPPSIRKTVVEAWEVPVPPIPEQRRIVDLLSRAEGIVRLRREAQKKAAEIIPALFLDMFGDPATNPKRWAVKELDELLSSVDYGSSTKALENGAGLPLIRMGNVDYAGNLDLANLKYVELSSADVARFRLEKGDILFNRTNSKELVGKTALWEESREAIAASYFIRLRVRSAVARPFFIWAFMNTPHMKRVFLGTARGAIGQANINSRELKAFRVPLPELETQQRFEARARDTLAIVTQQASATSKAEAAFSALLARTFSGEVRQAHDNPAEAAVA